MDFLQNLTSSEILFYLLLAGLLILAFVFNGKRRSSKSITIKNRTQIDMVKKYNRIMDKYNDMVERSSSIIDIIENNKVHLKSNDDYILVDKKINDFNICNSRFNEILNNLPDLIDKNKKIAFNDGYKDADIYINKMRNLIIEIGTVLEKEGYNEEQYNQILSQCGNIFSIEENRYD